MKSEEAQVPLMELLLHGQLLNSYTITARVGAKTLFATHFHELTELALTCTRVKNFNIAIKEWNDEIVFLRKVQEGAADKSFGIQVARLAGLPPEMIKRAKEILSTLENNSIDLQGLPVIAGKRDIQQLFSWIF